MAKTQYYGTGRRKSSVARVRLVPGTGNITVNKNAIPNDPEKPFVTSGIRVGTPAVTSRGFGKEEMLLIAKWMKLVATDFDANKDQIKAEVEALCKKFPIYE